MTQVQHAEMLKLITQSFCRELINFGVPRTSLPTIAAEVLDYVMKNGERSRPNGEPHVPELLRSRIESGETPDEPLHYDNVSIRRLSPEQLPTVVEWLTMSDVQRHFAVMFPTAAPEIEQYFFETPENDYFGIFYGDTFVGVIGGEQIDHRLQRLEMKKFIGDLGYRGLGIGKTATFLWLHHVFDRMHFNKVFIYALDTNLRNINLNNQLGFELEGILFEDAILDEKFCDVARMGLLKSKWDELFLE